MSAQKTAAWAMGSVLKIEHPSDPGTYIEIAAQFEGDGPSRNREVYETTDHQDLENNNGYKTYIGGLKDGGEVSGSLYFDPSEPSHMFTVGILSDLNNNTTVPTNWRKCLSTEPQYEEQFCGILTAFNTTTPTNDTIKASFTIKVSGEPLLVLS